MELGLAEHLRRPLGVLMSRSEGALSLAASLAAGLALAAGVLVVTSGTSSADRPQSASDEALRLEREIASCMSSKGQKYVAHVPLSAQMEDALHRAAEQGADQRAAVEAVRAKGNNDPNDALLATLSASEKADYQEALDGEQGCRTLLFERQNAIADAQLQAELNRLGISASFAEEIAQRPTVKAEERGYIQCMAGGGYSVSAIDDVYRHYGPEGDMLPADTLQASAVTKAALDRHDVCRRNYQAAYDKAYLELFRTTGR